MTDSIENTGEGAALFARTGLISGKRPSMVHAHMTAERWQRRADICAAFRAGKTTTEVGAEFGISGVRVGQILRECGIATNQGGKAQQMRLKRESRQSEIEARCMKLRGMALAEYSAVPNELKVAYQKQRACAGIRGLAWELNFAQWLAVWRDSGHLDQRGRSKNDYVMSRPGDTGPYAVGNVVITQNFGNVSEAMEAARGRSKTHKGVFLTYPGRERAWLAKVGKKRLGFYESQDAAAGARAKYIKDHHLRVDRSGAARGHIYV